MWWKCTQIDEFMMLVLRIEQSTFLAKKFWNAEINYAGLSLMNCTEFLLHYFIIFREVKSKWFYQKFLHQSIVFLTSHFSFLHFLFFSELLFGCFFDHAFFLNHASVFLFLVWWFAFVQKLTVGSLFFLLDELWGRFEDHWLLLNFELTFLLARELDSFFPQDLLQGEMYFFVKNDLFDLLFDCSIHSIIPLLL